MDRGDQELLSLLATDLDSNFRQLVESYQQRLYLFALRLVGRPDEAEDIVQEAFLRAYYALKGKPTGNVGIQNLRQWLYIITLNIFRNCTRKHEQPVVSLDLPENSMLLDIADHALGPDEEAQWHEWRHELEAHIASLPECYREAVTLYLFEEFSYSEIAKLLHQPINTIKVYIFRAKKLLRKLLEPGTE
ncbi:MAG TPA: RNA polymerase sigma factor [Ktedonobacteraceae bacterium]